MKLRYRTGSALNNLVRRMKGGGGLSGDGVDYEKDKKGYGEYSQDEGFQDWLRSTGQTYSPEYSGEALTSGGGSGSVRSALGNTPYAELAVNPELLPELSERGSSEEYGGLTAGPGGSRPTRGSQMAQAAELFRKNRQMEIDYEAWLSKQRNPSGPAKPVYEVLPGARNERGIQTTSDSFRRRG